jgi:hypothetical protein
MMTQYGTHTRDRMSPSLTRNDDPFATIDLGPEEVEELMRQIRWLEDHQWLEGDSANGQTPSAPSEPVTRSRRRG